MFGVSKWRGNMNPATKGAEADQNTDQRHRISIVDDDPSVRRALNRLFRSAGYIVTAYDSAEAFLEAAVVDETDFLILDVHLPGRSGLQLQLELQTSNDRLPVIFITAFDEEPTRIKAMESGAVEFLRKPIDSERLLDLIRLTLDDKQDQ